MCLCFYHFVFWVLFLDTSSYFHVFRGQLGLFVWNLDRMKFYFLVNSNCALQYLLNTLHQISDVSIGATKFLNILLYVFGLHIYSNSDSQVGSFKIWELFSGNFFSHLASILFIRNLPFFLFIKLNFWRNLTFLQAATW